MDQAANNPLSTVWWVLGMDSEGLWHVRRILAQDVAQVNAWWQERAGRLPDIAWEANEAIARIEEGMALLASWPSLPGIAPAKWFLGWLGCPKQEQVALVAVPAADRVHAAHVLSNERPDCQAMILGDTGLLREEVQCLRLALGGDASAVDENLLPKPPVALSEDLSTWLAQQFEMDVVP